MPKIITFFRKLESRMWSPFFMNAFLSCEWGWWTFNWMYWSMWIWKICNANRNFATSSLFGEWFQSYLRWEILLKKLPGNFFKVLKYSVMIFSSRSWSDFTYCCVFCICHDFRDFGWFSIFWMILDDFEMFDDFQYFWKCWLFFGILLQNNIISMVFIRMFIYLRSSAISSYCTIMKQTCYFTWHT